MLVFLFGSIPFLIVYTIPNHPFIALKERSFQLSKTVLGRKYTVPRDARVILCACAQF